VFGVEIILRDWVEFILKYRGIQALGLDDKQRLLYSNISCFN